MIERQRSAVFVNEVINHPSVHPWVCGPIDGPLDVTESIGDGSYTALFGEHGGFLFWRMGCGIYDAHSAVLPEGRGKWALDAAKDALAWMFEREGALEIMMSVPKGNIAVRALVRRLKAKFRGSIENGWCIGGQMVPVDVYSLTRADYERCRLPHH